jgi:hypothetical protein
MNATKHKKQNKAVTKNLKTAFKIAKQILKEFPDASDEDKLARAFMLGYGECLKDELKPLLK